MRMTGIAMICAGQQNKEIMAIAQCYLNTEYRENNLARTEELQSRLRGCHRNMHFTKNLVVQLTRKVETRQEIFSVKVEY